MNNLQLGWSFIIVTSGEFNEHLNSCVSSVIDASIDESYEIIVVGGVGEFDQRFIHIEFEEEKPYYSLSNIKEELLKAWSTLGLLVQGQQRSIATILKKKLSRMDFREAGASTQ